jgi:hypothetical protein
MELPQHGEELYSLLAIGELFLSNTREDDEVIKDSIGTNDSHPSDELLFHPQEYLSPEYLINATFRCRRYRHPSWTCLIPSFRRRCS